jgi:hypothetical protein
MQSERGEFLTPLAHDAEGHSNPSYPVFIGWASRCSETATRGQSRSGPLDSPSHRTRPVLKFVAHVFNSMEQAVDGKAVAGALSKPEDRLLIVVGHDTNSRKHQRCVESLMVDRWPA